MWESAERQTRSEGSDIDAVGIVAVLNDPDATTTSANKGPSILLEKQFRPAVGKIAVEVPAGLIDAGESPSEAAIRELREETGYVGTISSRSGGGGCGGGGAAEGVLMFNDPGFCNTNTKMIFVDVDMRDPRNRDPKPELEDGEFIETFTIPLRGFWEELGRLEKQGYAIDARVATLAQGLEMAKMWKGVV